MADSLTGEAAKLFATLVEHIGPLQQWPKQNLTAMLSTHLMYDERKSLTFFVLGNHGPPNVYVQYLMARKMLHCKESMNHMASLIKDHMHGKLAKFTTYMLPFRVTAPDKPVTERKHKWDGVGDPMPRNSTGKCFVFPVVAPGPIVMQDEGWRWQQAYSMLTKTELPIYFSSNDRQVKIVPYQEPDIENGLYADTADTYNYGEEHEIAHYNATHLNKKPRVL